MFALQDPPGGPNTFLKVPLLIVNMMYARLLNEVIMVIIGNVT